MLIRLTNKDGSVFSLNHRKIERINPRKDTVVELDNGKRYVVEESEEVIIEKIKKYEVSLNVMKNVEENDEKEE